jgi:hypothetical protein
MRPHAALAALSCALLLAAAGAAAVTPRERHVVSFAPGRGGDVEAQLGTLGLNVLTRGPGFLEVEARAPARPAVGLAGAREAAFVSSEVRRQRRARAAPQRDRALCDAGTWAVWGAPPGAAAPGPCPGWACTGRGRGHPRRSAAAAARPRGSTGEWGGAADAARRGAAPGPPDPLLPPAAGARATPSGPVPPLHLTRAKPMPNPNPNPPHPPPPQVTRISSLDGVTGVETDAGRAVWDGAWALGAGTSGLAEDWPAAMAEKRPPATDCTTLDKPLGDGPFPEVEPYYLKQVRGWVRPVYCGHLQPGFAEARAPASGAAGRTEARQAGALGRPGRAAHARLTLPPPRAPAPPRPAPRRAAQVQATSQVLKDAVPTTIGKGVLVCVIDSGVDKAHPEFAKGRDHLDGCKEEDTDAPAGCPFNVRRLVAAGWRRAGIASTLRGPQWTPPAQP